MVSLEDFKKIDIVVGKILSAEKVPETDKLLRLMVDFGDYETREKDMLQTNATSAAGVPVPELPVPSGDVPSAPALESSATSAAGRQIVSGISLYFPDCTVLIGKKCMFIANLEPRIIRGIESHGMILAVSTPEGKFSLLQPNEEIPAGTRAK